MIVAGLVAGLVLTLAAPVAHAEELDPPAVNDVPMCEDAEILVREHPAVLRTFPRPCGVYYYPYPIGTRFSSLQVWGEAGWYTVGSGLSDLFYRPPWQSRYPYPAVPSRFPLRPMRPAPTAPHELPPPSVRRPRQTAMPTTTQQAPWAAAAQRHTNPQQWRYSDAGRGAGTYGASKASPGSRNSTSAARSYSSTTRRQVPRTRYARTSNPRHRERH